MKPKAPTFASLIIAAALLTGVLFAQSPATPTSGATRPATQPAVVELRVKNRVSRLEFQQDGQTIPVTNGEIHLKPAPFSVRVRGNLDLGIVASERDTLARTLAAGRYALVYVRATNFAYEEGVLYLNEKADVVPWKEFVWTEPDSDALLRNNLGGELPVVLNCGSQWLCAFAPEGADEHTFEIRTLKRISKTLEEETKDHYPAVEWKDLKSVNLILIATAPLDGNLFEFTGVRSVRLVFNR